MQRLVCELLDGARPTFSFEFFPPKTDEGEARLWQAIRELEPLRPSFVDVTYGAGGSTRDRTLRVVQRIARETSLTAVAHLTCTGTSRAEVRKVVEDLGEAGIRNILALRGDAPGGPNAPWVPHEEGFEHAEELVRLIHDVGEFCVGVAAFPEVHPESPDRETDVKHFIRKIEAGADFAITQFFFDPGDYATYLGAVRAAGCDVPVIPGVMPVTNVRQITRMAELSGAGFPADLAARLCAVEEDPEAVRAIGVEVATELSLELLDAGAPGIHFYTLNRSTATREIYAQLHPGHASPDHVPPPPTERSNTMRVLVADNLAAAGIEALAKRFDVDVRTGLDKAALLGVIPAYDAVVVRSSTTIDADVVAAAERLKVIARAGIGLDNVDVDAATAKGVIVCNAPQSNVISAAEHTVALLLALARRIPAADASLRAGEWQRSAFEGVELHGKTLGILGLGRVGVLVAQRCSAFGMRLIAYDPFVSTERAARIGVELVGSVDEVCAQADVVTVHLPKTADTVGIIGEPQLRAMKPTALLVNTARGGLVDEAALHTALAEGWIAGAGLDVYATEPTTESPLFGLSNTVVTPHLGASTTEAQDKAGTMVAQAVALALEGEFVPSAVNVQVTASVPEAVKPFMALTEQLGRVLTALHSGQAGELVVEFHGRIAAEDTQAVTLSALKGVLQGVTSEPVTFVNAPLLAEERGLKVSTVASEAFEDFVSLVRLRLGDARLAGTLVGPKNKPRLVEVWGFAVDMELADHMLFFRYTDRPGIVGIMGNRLGEAQVNIATMQVGRQEQGGDAVIAMSIDSAAPAAVLEEIRERIGAKEARAIDLA